MRQDLMSRKQKLELADKLCPKKASKLCQNKTTSKLCFNVSATIIPMMVHDPQSKGKETNINTRQELTRR